LGYSFLIALSAISLCALRGALLIKSGVFSLPGKKELLKSDMEYEFILIDASESAIERPKKKLERRKE
jgi:hypothetical protein